MHPRRALVACAAVLILVGGSHAAGQAAAKSAKKKPAASKKQTTPAASKKSPAKTAKGKTASRRGKKKTIARGPTGPSRDRIREIQEALTKSGHYRKEPTGQMDATTIAALGKFQEDNGLERTGKLNVWTLRKLEQYGLPATSRPPAAATAAQANPSNP